VNGAEPATLPTTRYVGLMLTVGGALAIVANVMHPRYNGPDVDTYQRIAGSSTFLTADLTLTTAALLVTLGLVGLADRAGPDRPFAHAGRVTALVGGTIAVIQSGVELGGVRQQAITFTQATSTDHVVAFWATNALDGLSTALFALWTATLLGLTPLLLSRAVDRTEQPSSWARPLATLGTIGGLACLVIGVVDLVAHDSVNITVAFVIGSALVTLWILGTGWAMLAREPDLASRSQ
jgi:hypothetical protein